MDKLFKFIKGEKKTLEVKKEPEIIKEPINIPPKDEQVHDTPKNEILFLNNTSVENTKKHEGFYYKKYINDISKLKLVKLFNKV
jgi:hypothetical protein